MAAQLPHTPGEDAVRLLGRATPQPAAKDEDHMRQALLRGGSSAAFTAIAAALKSAGAATPELASLDQAISDLKDEEADHEARIQALEDGIITIATALGVEIDLTPATPPAAVLADPATTTADTATAVHGTETAAPIPTAGIAATNTVVDDTANETAKQTAEITPISDDPLRPGAGTVVTSPAPAAVPESAEPVIAEAPGYAASTVVTEPVETADGQTVAAVTSAS